MTHKERKKKREIKVNKSRKRRGRKCDKELIKTEERGKKRKGLKADPQPG